MEEKKRKKAIYSRKSKYTGKGESIENQIETCKDYLKRYMNINISDDDIVVFNDEGFTGANTDRPQFQEMLKSIRNNEIDTVICYRLDRISRSVVDFVNLYEEWQQYDVNFVSVKEQFDTSTPMGKAMLMISIVFAQLERDTIAERIRDNMYELAKTGRWLGGNVPLGFMSEKNIVMYANDEELLKKIEFYINNDVEREKIAQNGCRLVKERFLYWQLLEPYFN